MSAIDENTEAATSFNMPPRADRLQEQLWVLQAQQGNHEAFQSLVNQYDRRLLYFVMRFTNRQDQALDVLQEVWITIFRRLRKLRSPAAFRVWLYQIAHDKVVSLIRQSVREEAIHERLMDEQGNNADDADPISDNAELVHRVLGELSAEHREVLVLRFLEDLSLEEIGQLLRCSLGTVKSRLHYAKQAIKIKIARRHE
jgi:RNA polymerase sigma-70 factor (ECF subfamily)